MKKATVPRHQVPTLPSRIHQDLSVLRMGATIRKAINSPLHPKDTTRHCLVLMSLRTLVAPFRTTQPIMVQILGPRSRFTLTKVSKRRTSRRHRGKRRSQIRTMKNEVITKTGAPVTEMTM